VRKNQDFDSIADAYIDIGEQFMGSMNNINIATFRIYQCDSGYVKNTTQALTNSYK